MRKAGSLWIVTSVFLVSGFLQAAEKLTAEQVAGLIPSLFNYHLQQREMDVPFTRRLLNEYLNQLDPTRSMLLKDEAQAIVDLSDKQVERLIEQAQAGDLSYFKRTLNRYLEKIGEHAALYDGLDGRADEIRKLLNDKKPAVEPKEPSIVPLNEAPDFDDENEKIQWRERPATQAERENRLLRSIAGFFRINKSYLSENEAFKLAVQTFREDHRGRWLKVNVDEETPKLVLKAFMNAMDPHTDYFDAEEDEFTDRLKASFAGIGVQIRPCPLGAQVDEVIKGGPADRSAKFMARDQIVAVDDVSLSGMPINKIVKRIKGEIGTDVKLTVFRPSSKATDTIVLKRDKIALAEIRVKGKTFDTEQGRVGVVSVAAFYQGVHRDVRDRLREIAKDKPLAAVVLDLRSNHGGFLEEAVALTGLFIESGPVVGERDGANHIFWKNDTYPGAEYLGPLVVLVNQFSASASEIVAGTLKDYGRAVVVGASQTFGKGTVQRVVSLAQMRLPGEIKITTHQYFLAGGQSVQITGVQPDVTIPGPKLLDLEGMLEKNSPNAIQASKINGALNVAEPEVKLWLEWKATHVTELQEKSKQRSDANPELKTAFDPKKKKPAETTEEVNRDPDAQPALVDKKDEKDLQVDEAVAVARDMITTWPDVTKHVSK